MPLVIVYAEVSTFMFVVIIGGYEMVVGAQKLGRSRGYQPEQPIHFSHRIHAGLNKIDCKYCHAGVEKSKAASIPSINICMNCHKGVAEGETDAGTAEIQKIYYYAGYNKDKGDYSMPQFAHGIRRAKITKKHTVKRNEIKTWKPDISNNRAFSRKLCNS